uniref:Factor of DNA methylation 1-5/IDN2 domain-containing protein n=1 Tax=Aureoumbra lagunensis TaxID=44058 RepID=A0A7S3JNS0_9STRA|mmetsp:Transcript_7806/g.10890  ORF Transcript_7806/g.10890 Transcript_7806/m.10890 type:complete len:457 (+) Transcript_7806:100-1470(+)
MISSAITTAQVEDGVSETGETVPTALEIVSTPRSTPQEAKMLVVPVTSTPKLEGREAAWRLQYALANEVETTCEKLRAAFLSRLSREREEHEALWTTKENTLIKELELRLFEATESAKAKFAAFEAKQALINVAATGENKSSKKVPCGSGQDINPEIERLKEKLAEKEAELELAYATCQPVVEAERQAQARLSRARQAAIEAAKLNQAPYPIKVMGVLDPLKLLNAGMTAIEISALQERIRNPDFHITKIILDERGNMPKQVIDYNHPELVALHFDFGQVVIDEVVRCFLELDTWNPSGRYHVPLPWNVHTDSELEPADIISKLAQQNTEHQSTEHCSNLPPPSSFSSAASAGGTDVRSSGTTIARRPSRRNRNRIATFADSFSSQNTLTSPSSSTAEPSSRPQSIAVLPSSRTTSVSTTSSQIGTPSWVRTPRSIFSFPWNNSNRNPSSTQPSTS